MPVQSGAEVLPGKNRRVARRNVPGDISPGLRKQITQAAGKIRGAHGAELADVSKADLAGRLFSSLIGVNGRTPGQPQKSSRGYGENVESLAGDLGGLLSEAIRAGTDVLEGSLTVLAQAWLAMAIGPSAEPSLEASSAAGSVSGKPSQPPQAAAVQIPGTAVDTAAPGQQAPEAPTSSPGELMLRGVLRQFMPMLLTSLNQGGDGYGLAKTVIRLFGRSTYDQASGLGKDRIMQILKSEPDLWSQVAPIEARFSRFLDEFTGYGDQADIQPQSSPV